MEDFYHFRDFQKYLDRYARAIKYYSLALHHYANVDVIGNPQLSFQNPTYLGRKLGLCPVPVLHAGVDCKSVRYHRQY